MKAPPRFEVPADSSEFRDWSHLPDLPLSEVLGRLVPCLPSLAVFAATCRRWRRFLLASASTLILPRIPPLLLHRDQSKADQNLLHAFSRGVIRKPVTSPTAASPSTLLSSSRGHLIFLARPRGLLLLVDAFTGVERFALPLPSPHYPHHYATLTATRLLLFVSKHAFVSLPFPFPPPDSVPEWTHHRLPRAASFVASVVEFRGRVLGVTDRAQLLEFRLGAASPDEEVQLLPAAGLPDAAAFESWHFGPRLVAAGERLLLLLLRTSPEGSGGMRQPSWVWKVGVYALVDKAEGTRWEETDNLGGYSVFVDRAGRSAVACADAGGCGAEGNRVYFAERWYHEGSQRLWKWFRPGEGWEGDERDQGLYVIGRMPTQAWVYPRLFFGR
ncbi:hypothetical protein ACP70R_013550 [Stipagrostis hirtigluma subsp. patula]